jgi:hypothetical protein
MLICWQLERKTASKLEAPIKSDISQVVLDAEWSAFTVHKASHSLQIFKDLDSSLPCHGSRAAGLARKQMRRQ